MSLSALMVALSHLTGNVYFSFGSDSGLHYNQHKYVTVGYSSALTSLLDQQIEIGAWAVSKEQERSAGYVAYQTGLKTKGSLYASALSGVALITNTDARLSSVFQFKHTVGVGVRDYRGVEIGVDYSHISNAGLSLPNAGRDFVQLRMSVPFN